MPMTKGQTAAADFIDALIKVKRDKFSYQELTRVVKFSGARVRNWLTIRGVIQYYLNEKKIERTDDIFVEEYKILK